MQEKRDLDVLIVDKTVPTNSYREHKGLIWILNYNHWQNAGREYSASDDYAGWRPKDLTRRRDEASIWPIPKEEYDLIYLADTYGIYEDNPEEDGKKGVRADIVYGGVTKEEIDQIEKQLRPGGTLIAEFNSFADPTKIAERERLSKLVGVKWTGWIGRYVEDLNIKSSEIPEWMPAQYALHAKNEWAFDGPGFIFIHNNGRIVVLEEQEDVKKDGLKINFTDDAVEKYKTTDNIAYNYWFDVMEARPDGNVLANYEFDLTDSGKAILEDAGIPRTFPAAINTTSNHRTTYYFAGDWIDKKDFPKNYHIWQVGLNQERYNDDFFWHVYAPLMEEILTDTYHRQTNGF